MKKRNDFEILITGVKDNDRYVYHHVGDEKDIVFFTLEYKLPHQRFSGIREFQKSIRFQPFVNSTKSDKYVVVDLSQWTECNRWEEEYLEIFLKFLHDFGDGSIFDYHYIILVGDKGINDIKGIYGLLAQYLYGGCINEKYASFDMVELLDYIGKIGDKQQKGAIGECKAVYAWV